MVDKHEYNIRIAGDLLVTVEYDVWANGMLGPANIDQDDLARVLPADLHPHWVKEMAFIYRAGYNNAIAANARVSW